MEHIPLTSAYLCPDCNSIGNCPAQCPACSCEVLLSLSVVLDRAAEGAGPTHPFLMKLAA
jgi:hypothetical protein